MKPSFRWMLERPGFGICTTCLTEKPEAEMQIRTMCRLCHREYHRQRDILRRGPPRTKLTDEELAARAAARQKERNKAKVKTGVTGMTHAERSSYRVATTALVKLAKRYFFPKPPKKYYTNHGKVFDTEFERDEYVRGWREYKEWCAENREAIKAAQLERERTKRAEERAAKGLPPWDHEERRARAVQTKRERQRWKDYKKRARNGADGKPLPLDFEEKQLVAQGGCCFYCQVEVSDDYHLDHVLPIAKGGQHHPSNLVVACPTCNMRKADKMPWEFKAAA